MTLITIPKKLAQKGDLALVPLKEYEEFLKFKKIREFTATAEQKRALTRARRNFRAGRTLSLDELRHKLGFRN